MRNFGSSLGLAVFGSILIFENRSNLESTAAEHGVPKQAADQIADAISQGSGGGEAHQHISGAVAKVADSIPHDFALASEAGTHPLVYHRGGAPQPRHRAARLPG